MAHVGQLTVAAGDQLNVTPGLPVPDKMAVPPETIVLPAPALTAGPPTEPTVPEAELTHPNESVIVTVYNPEGIPVMEAVVAPPGDQEYVNAPVPPDAATAAAPSLNPHVAVVVLTTPDTGEGCVIVMIVVVEQPAPSVIVTV